MADEFDNNLKHLGEDFTEKQEDPVIEGDANGADTQDSGSAEDSIQAGNGQDAIEQDSNSGKPNSGKQQGKEEKPPKSGSPKDLTLPDGSVVKAGAERRFYEQLQVSKQQLGAMQKETQAIKTTLQTTQQELQTLRQVSQGMSGVPLEQQAVAVRLYQDLAKDTVGTLTKLLAEAKAKGYSIDGIGGAVDTAAIQLMLKNQSQQTVTQQGPTQEEIDQQASAEVGKFFSDYPDAVMHDEILADIVIKHPHLSLQDAYFELKSSVINRGLDWSRPIKPQLQTQQNPQPQQRNPAPMINGRSGITPIVEEKMNLSSQDGETTDDIIRAAMRDAGYANTR